MKLNYGIESLGSNPVVVAVSEKHEFSDGKKGERIGTTYDVLLPHARFEKLRVTTPELTPSITQEELDALNARMTPMRISFEGFAASPYVDRAGNVAYSAKADRAVFPGRKEGA